MFLRGSAVLLCACASGLLLAQGAVAAPPSNDARALAVPLTLPADTRGTTVEAGLDGDEPAPACGSVRSSVWYAFESGEDGSVVIAIDAEGDLDALVDVFVRERSQITPLNCRRTNRRGALTFELEAEAGTSYLVRVAARANSEDDRFRLRVIEPERAARFPGERLPRRGAADSVDRLANPDDAWSVRLRAGTAYRVNLVSSGGRCGLVELHAPGGGEVQRRLRCDAHTVFVPPAGGLHTLHVQAPRASRDRIRYRLRVGPAAADDSAPGLVLPNDVPVRGRLSGSELDAVDLYRFTLADRSTVRFALRTGADFELRLLSDAGRRLATSGDSLERRLEPGRYFLAVHARDGADGRYVLRRLARIITRADLSVDGGSAATVAPGGSVSLVLAVTPSVAGRAELTVERFDPLAGWLFHGSYRPAVNAGRGTLSFRPPAVGRWRAAGTFLGTRRAAPSDGGSVRFDVEEPLGR